MIFLAQRGHRGRRQRGPAAHDAVQDAGAEHRGRARVAVGEEPDAALVAVGQAAELEEGVGVVGQGLALGVDLSVLLQPVGAVGEGERGLVSCRRSCIVTYRARSASGPAGARRPQEADQTVTAARPAA
ncbi:hypothetical protein CD790_33555 [Streptomyces sp. SAJ15]|nr:hypothetical protein CD790_33555 [Streptomyces sp. SAJ15]